MNEVERLKQRNTWLERCLEEALEELRDTYYFDSIFPKGNIGPARVEGEHSALRSTRLGA